MKKILFMLLCCINFSVLASESLVETNDSVLQYNLFASQSLVKTSDGVRISGKSDSNFGSIGRSELGGTLAYQANENVDFRGMTSVIRDGDSDTKFRINYALIDLHKHNGMFGVRLGRFSYDYGFYNAGRNNPNYRDMELPPQSIYREGLKYMSRSGDGVQLYGTYHINENYTLETDFSYSNPIIYPQNDIVQTFVFDKNLGKIKSNSPVKSLNFTLYDRVNGWTLKYDYIILDYNLRTTFFKPDEYNIKVKTHYYGVRKYFDFGDITLEYMRPSISKDKFDNASYPNYNWGQTDAYNITYKHYITSKLSGMIGYDFINVNDKDKYGHAFEAISGIPSSILYHSSINTGLKYREQNYSIKAEFHHVKGTNTVRADDNDVLKSSQPKKYNIFILTFTYNM